MPDHDAPFDTLKLAEALKATPLGRDGGEAVARALADIAMTEVVTRRDLDEAVEKLEKAQLRQTISLTGIVAAIVALAAGLTHFLH